jgi:hypothetical protein
LQNIASAATASEAFLQNIAFATLASGAFLQNIAFATLATASFLQNIAFATLSTASFLQSLAIAAGVKGPLGPKQACAGPAGQRRPDQTSVDPRSLWVSAHRLRAYSVPSNVANIWEKSFLTAPG